MRARLWLLALGMAVTGMVNAAMVGPQVSYSAHMTMESAEGVTEGPVYSKPGMERREFVKDGASTVMIIRQDKKLAWMLMPNDKMYMEMKFPKEGRKDDLSSYHIDSTVVGHEKVNGMDTTKSKIIMTSPNGDKMGGFWWAIKEGIIVKMDAIAMDKKKKNKARFKLELTDLKIGRLKPKLFEVPKDYEKMDMSMGGIGKMMLNGDDDEDTQDDDGKKAGEVKEKKSGFGLKNLFDLVK